MGPPQSTPAEPIPVDALDHQPLARARRLEMLLPWTESNATEGDPGQCCDVFDLRARARCLLETERRGKLLEDLVTRGMLSLLDGR